MKPHYRTFEERLLIILPPTIIILVIIAITSDNLFLVSFTFINNYNHFAYNLYF